MQTRGVLYRTLGAFTGAGAGFVSGTAAAMAIDWRGGRDNGARASIVGGGAAGILLGYLAGNRADRRWTTIEILP
jgi:MFS family permease